LTEKATFLGEAPASDAKEAAFAEDRDADGYVNTDAVNVIPRRLASG
jgi:hypothetical protein